MAVCRTLLYLEMTEKDQRRRTVSARTKCRLRIPSLYGVATLFGATYYYGVAHPPIPA